MGRDRVCDKYNQEEYTTKIIYVQPTRNAAPSADVAASGANSAVPFPNQIKVAWRPPNKPLLWVKQAFGAMACSPMPLIQPRRRRPTRACGIAPHSHCVSPLK